MRVRVSWNDTYTSALAFYVPTAAHTTMVNLLSSRAVSAVNLHFYVCSSAHGRKTQSTGAAILFFFYIENSLLVWPTAIYVSISSLIHCKLRVNEREKVREEKEKHHRKEEIILFYRSLWIKFWRSTTTNKFSRPNAPKCNSAIFMYREPFKALGLFRIKVGLPNNNIIQ